MFSRFRRDSGPEVGIVSAPLLFMIRVIGPPGPLHFDSGVKIHCLILALGDLQWVRGPFGSYFFELLLSSSFLRLLLRLRLVSVLVLSCPGAEKRDPSYPPLVGSPSLPTPCEDREDGYTTRGGRWGFLFRPLGLVIAKPYSCRGLALFCFGSCVNWLFKPFSCS